MTKYILVILLFPIFFGCSNDTVNNNNRYLPNYNFSIDINMDLPLYTNLQFTGNPVYIDQAGIGITGVFVMNTGSGYVAYEATCPNQEIASCSAMTLNGINAVCPCDDAEYSLFNGQSEGKEFPLKPYSIQIISPTVIRVYN
ncbi:hypothetical protein E0W68_12505 [Flavobacterium salilacus subsp. salilacus]|nr:hypothetical protein E0W68_12505 [Flavobacterium salilacus subsp. salilacus]MBE1615430.1 hypothetical protein [Flavobacterium sp. SaA2.13]NDI99505.1 hypothetical protein [Flavobacterium salilacus subsp. altitudinum]